MFGGFVRWHHILIDVAAYDLRVPPSVVMIEQPDGSVVGIKAPPPGLFCMDYKKTFFPKKVFERRPPKGTELLRYECVLKTLPTPPFETLEAEFKADGIDVFGHACWAEAVTTTPFGAAVQTLRTQLGVKRCGLCRRATSSYAATSTCRNANHEPWHTPEALAHILSQPDGFVLPLPDSKAVFGRFEPFPQSACEAFAYEIYTHY